MLCGRRELLSARRLVVAYMKRYKYTAFISGAGLIQSIATAQNEKKSKTQLKKSLETTKLLRSRNFVFRFRCGTSGGFTNWSRSEIGTPRNRIHCRKRGAKRRNLG